MQKMVQHIESLLQDNNFVIIPGFGGFVAEVSASIEIDGMLYPPHKEVGFNPALNYNDGLLAQMYVKSEGVTFDEASAIIATKVAQLKEALDTWHHFRFGTVGMFHLTASGLQFEPFHTNNFLRSSFGLVPVYFPVIEKNTAAMPMPAPVEIRNGVEFTEKKESREGIGYKIVAAAAILLLLILFPLNVNDGRRQIAQPSEQASIIPNLDTILLPEVIEAEEVTEPEDSASYHVIIGSFYSKRKALQFLEEIPSEMSEQCNIVFSEHRYRVSYKTFTDELECDTFIESFTAQNPRFADAWILELTDSVSTVNCQLSTVN